MKLLYISIMRIGFFTDIYAPSVDYDRKSPIIIKFFKKVQNKMHYAVSHQTAAEIIYNCLNSKKNYM